MNLELHPDALRDMQYWSLINSKKLSKILSLIEEILKSPFVGIGKPEPLKHQLVGCWSRRIDSEHRIIYQVKGDKVAILQCRYHYR